jgi:hypothetical protein
LVVEFYFDTKFYFEIGSPTRLVVALEYRNKLSHTWLIHIKR